jgi:YidC/Oxa1 family membrane protein insertase
MFEFLGQALRPLEIAVAWIMVTFHSALTAIGMPAASGWTWALSIVGLVIVIRILLIPLFVKQINASRGMQLIQPEMKKIQQKYKGKSDTESRKSMQEETMGLYKRTGTNPFASCLPILLQSPIFFALFRVLNGLSGIASGKNDPVGPITEKIAAQAESSTLFGAQLSSTFLGSDDLSVKILTVVLIILMSGSTFTTQRQLMMKNMPAAALDNPFAQQQKLLLYVLPVIFAVSGVNFPIGVLIYWLTTNVWSMGQQFFVIRRMPAPGSPAERALQARRTKRGKGGVEPAADGAALDGVPPTDQRPAGQRQQPKKQARSKRTGQRRPPGAGGSGRPPGAGSSGSRSGGKAGEGSEEPGPPVPRA